MAVGKTYRAVHRCKAHKREFILGVVERMCAEDEQFAVALLERLGIPVVSRATKDALHDVSRRVRLGLPATDEEIEDVLYAVGVSLEEAAKL
jgi:hypothetical protein